MGRYINSTPERELQADFSDKVLGLIDAGALVVTGNAFNKENRAPEKWEPNLVVVVDNGNFAAALYVEDEAEFKRVTEFYDPRPRIWFTWELADKYAK